MLPGKLFSVTLTNQIWQDSLATISYSQSESWIIWEQYPVPQGIPEVLKQLCSRKHNFKVSGLEDSFSKTIFQGTLEGGRHHGRQRKCWMYNIKDWTSLPMPKLLTKASFRKDWKRILLNGPSCPLDGQMTKLDWLPLSVTEARQCVQTVTRVMYGLPYSSEKKKTKNCIITSKVRKKSVSSELLFVLSIIRNGASRQNEQPTNSLTYSQVQRVEEEDKIFSLEVRQLDVFELSIDHCCTLEVWGRMLHFDRQASGTCHSPDRTWTTVIPAAT